MKVRAQQNSQLNSRKKKNNKAVKSHIPIRMPIILVLRSSQNENKPDDYRRISSNTNKQISIPYLRNCYLPQLSHQRSITVIFNYGRYPHRCARDPFQFLIVHFKSFYLIRVNKTNALSQTQMPIFDGQSTNEWFFKTKTLFDKIKINNNMDQKKALKYSQICLQYLTRAPLYIGDSYCLSKNQSQSDNLIINPRLNLQILENYHSQDQNYQTMANVAFLQTYQQASAKICQKGKSIHAEILTGSQKKFIIQKTKELLYEKLSIKAGILKQVIQKLFQENLNIMYTSFIQFNKSQMLQQLKDLCDQMIISSSQVIKQLMNVDHSAQHIASNTNMSSQVLKIYQQQWIGEIRRILEVIVRQASKTNQSKQKDEDIFVPSGRNVVTFIRILKGLSVIYIKLRKGNPQKTDFIKDYYKRLLEHLLKEVQALKPSQSYLNFIEHRRVLILLYIYGQISVMSLVMGDQSQLLKRISLNSIAKLKDFKRQYQNEAEQFFQYDYSIIFGSLRQKCANLEEMLKEVQIRLKNENKIRRKDTTDGQLFALIDLAFQIEISRQKRELYVLNK